MSAPLVSAPPCRPRYPALYQVNTRVWLTELSRTLGRPATLDDIPDAELDRLAALGFDWIWLLSVWQTGPAAQAGLAQQSRVAPRVRRRRLPDLRDEDIAGSGFAITGYTVHRDLGGDAALARLRERLQQRGLKLMLDFVPNHMALGSSLGREHPDYLRPRHAKTTWLARRRTTCRSSAKQAIAAARLRPRPVLRRLARHAAAQLRQPRICRRR